MGEISTEQSCTGWWQLAAVSSSSSSSRQACVQPVTNADTAALSPVAPPVPCTHIVDKHGQLGRSLGHAALANQGGLGNGRARPLERGASGVRLQGQHVVARGGGVVGRVGNRDAIDALQARGAAGVPGPRRGGAAAEGREGDMGAGVSHAHKPKARKPHAHPPTYPSAQMVPCT